MSIVQRKDKINEASSAAKIFVPTVDEFLLDPPLSGEALQVQFPPAKRKEPFVTVGIMSQSVLDFVFIGDFTCVQTAKTYTGIYQAHFSDGKVLFDNQLFDQLFFEPTVESCSVFELQHVKIGIDFHWERFENQQFKGALKVIVEDEKLIAINQILVEDYLVSVIASEMSATASLELLKAHAVISRSWLLAPMQNKNHRNALAINEIKSDNEVIKWYERDAHKQFDVCADDHCQRYQGIARARTLLVYKAIELTRGQVLSYKGDICDARFSKSCGGVSELFENCWSDEPHDYLAAVRDDLDPVFPDLTIEEHAQLWIRTSPSAFCNTTDKEILGQVLTNYDQETTDFYRWKVSYTVEQLSELLKKRSEIDFGLIHDLIPLERGASGRITKLRIVGTKRTFTVGKELEIRKWLSESHLYSSAFVIDKTETGFLLTGAGWGHGVGLCQIGAAVMGAKGYQYDEILRHYFRGATLEKRY